MKRLAAIASMLLLGAGAAPAVHAVEIATYGTGLESCKSYADAREQLNADEVPFIDWLAGYLSGVNATSNHRNNILGLSDVRGTMYWLDGYCRRHPAAHFAEAAGMFLMHANSLTGAHSVEVTAYGSGFKSCAVYLEGREQQDVDATAFIDWLGGYLSGVNAISNSTQDILGRAPLTEAVYWLDGYCSSHQPAPFAAAVESLIAAHHREK
jgi:hypothetical protein